MARLEDTEIFGDLEVSVSGSFMTGDVLIGGTDALVEITTSADGDEWIRFTTEDGDDLWLEQVTSGSNADWKLMNNVGEILRIWEHDLGTSEPGMAISANLTIGSTSTTTDALRVDGNADFNGNLDVSGTIVAQTITAYNAFQFSGTNDNPVSLNVTDDSWNYISFKHSGVRKAYIGIDSVPDLRIIAEAGDVDIQGTEIKLNNNTLVYGDTLHFVESAADLEGLRFSRLYQDENSSSRIFFAEQHAGLYGFSWIYAGNPNPTLDGTAFTLTANTFNLMRHDAVAAGASVLSIARATGHTTFTPNVSINYGDGTYGLSTGISLYLGTDGSKCGAIRLYGTTASGGALIQTSTNNLHLDALGGAIYLGHYDPSNVYLSGYLQLKDSTVVDPGADAKVNLGVNANALRVYTNHGYVDLGPQSATYCHIYSDRSFYTNKLWYFNSTSYYITGGGVIRMGAVQTNTLQSTTDSDHKIYLDPATDKIRFHPGDTSTDNAINMWSVTNSDTSPIIKPCNSSGTDTDGYGYIGTSTAAWKIVYRKSESTHTPCYLSGATVPRESSNIHIETTRHFHILRSQIYRQKLTIIKQQNEINNLKARVEKIESLLHA